MEILEIITDIYFALGSAISAVGDRFKNYNKILSFSSIGDSTSYTYLLKFKELADSINHEQKAKIMLVDQMSNKNSEVYIHCVLLDSRNKYVNSLTIKESASHLSNSILPIPKYWNI